MKKYMALAIILSGFFQVSVARADFPDSFLTFKGIAYAYEACRDAGYSGVSCREWVVDGKKIDRALVCECVDPIDSSTTSELAQE
ncbi:MAG: hypothetical protein K1X79_13570 [Oligoflexia bacterium]|nr:hypothetical protein [Oligoflexia bacterium]